MPDHREEIEPETQHEKKQAATQGVPVDEEPEDDIPQETQHYKKQAATRPGERDDRRSSS